MSDKSISCNDNEVQKALAKNNFCDKFLIVLFLDTVHCQGKRNLVSVIVIYVLFFQTKNDVQSTCYQNDTAPVSQPIQSHNTWIKLKKISENLVTRQIFQSPERKISISGTFLWI